MEPKNKSSIQPVKDQQKSNINSKQSHPWQERIKQHVLKTYPTMAINTALRSWSKCS
jgi:hypothetical protein